MTSRPAARSRLCCSTIVAAVLAAAALTYGAPAQAESGKVLRMGHILAPESQLGAGASAMADELAKRTGGRLPSSSSPIRCSAATSSCEGRAARHHRSGFHHGAGLSNVMPELGMFNIPFLLRDTAHAYAVLDGPVGQSYLQKVPRQGSRRARVGRERMRHITNSKRAIPRPAGPQGPEIARAAVGSDAGRLQGARRRSRAAAVPAAL